MELNHKIFGKGEPVILLHGLFGMLDNWQTIGKALAEDFMVILVDQRNHGRSPFVDSMNYPALADDLREFMLDNWIHSAHIFGHSMGGKTAMQFAFDYPDQVGKLIVIDIGPQAYPGGHEDIFEALFSLKLDELKDRGEAGDLLSETIFEPSVVRFFLKNLARKKEGGYRWKMNLPVLYKHYRDILASVSGPAPFENPALFIKGELSNYLQPGDLTEIQKLFPEAALEIVENAGHWIHTDAPKELIRLVRAFLKE